MAIVPPGFDIRRIAQDKVIIYQQVRAKDLTKLRDKLQGRIDKAQKKQAKFQDKLDKWTGLDEEVKKGFQEVVQGMAPPPQWQATLHEINATLDSWANLPIQPIA